MVEDILKKDGLSFALLRKLSFRTRLEENLAQAISCLDEAFLTEELKISSSGMIPVIFYPDFRLITASKVFRRSCGNINGHPGKAG